MRTELNLRPLTLVALLLVVIGGVAGAQARKVESFSLVDAQGKQRVQRRQRLA